MSSDGNGRSKKCVVRDGSTIAETASGATVPEDVVHPKQKRESQYLILPLLY